MQFQVPQFIEVEDKVVGPLTFRQFVYLAGSLGLGFLLYLFLPGLIAFPLIIAVVGLGVALAFYKINNKPFIDFLAASFRYLITTKLYIWKKKPKKPEAHQAREVNTLDTLSVPKMSDSKLKDLAWSLDVHDSFGREREEGNE